VAASTTIRTALPGSRIDPHLRPATRAEVGGRVRERMTFALSVRARPRRRVRLCGGEPVAEGTDESVQRLG
jgi:hypothetical protein